MVPSLSSAEPAEAAVTYREQPVPPALAPWVRCLWQLTVQAGGPGRVVPDGFMDLVASGPVVTLAGPDTRPWPVRRQPGAVAVGVRFHPGAAPAPLGPLRAGPGGPPSLAEVAVRAGYADQAHMTAECTRLAGRSPATLAAGG